MDSRDLLPHRLIRLIVTSTTDGVSLAESPSREPTHEIGRLLKALDAATAAAANRVAWRGAQSATDDVLTAAVARLTTDLSKAELRLLAEALNRMAVKDLHPA